MESRSVQLTKEEIKDIDKLAKKESRSFAGQVRHLVRIALGSIKK